MIKPVIVIAGLVLTNQLLSQVVETYPLPSVFPVSTIYKVSVNGTNVPVTQFIHQGEISYHYAHFSFSGTAEITINAADDISYHRIRPESFNIASTRNGKQLGFTVAEPKYLVIDINSYQKLVLLADPAETDKPSLSDPDVTNVIANGIDSEGQIESSAKIQSLIDSISAQGGGTLYFPEGVYKVKTVAVKDNVDIYLAGGAIVRGTGNKLDYPEYDPDEFRTITSIFVVENASNVRIYGRGTIDGLGVQLADNVDDIKLAPMKIRAVSIHHSSHVQVDGIIARELTSWAIPFFHSDHVRASRVKVLDYIHLKNSDGINMCASQHGVVEDCFVMAGDDAYCAKGHTGEPCHDIVFRNSVAYSATRGITFGMQAYEKMYDIWFENIDVVKTRDGIDLKHNDGYGVWEDLHIIDVRVDECTGQPIKMRIKEGGAINDVEITRFSCRTAGSKDSYLYGLDSDSKITNVVFTDTYIDGKLVLNAADGNIDLNRFTEQISFGAVGHTSTRGTGIMESEHMMLFNYEVENIQGASNGKGVACQSDSGTAHYVYTGNQGIYDMSIYYWDENDGVSSYQLSIDDSVYATWKSDQNLGSSEADSTTLTKFDLAGVSLIPFQEIKVICLRGGNESGSIDKVEINLLPVEITDTLEFFFEAESGDVGSGWTIVADSTASKGKYIAYLGESSDNNDTPPDNPEEISTYRFEAESGLYKLWIRMRHPNGGTDDSFWIRVNYDSWIKWNGIAKDLPNDIFLWAGYGAEFPLREGENTIEFGYRETDARLDMICLSNTDKTPDPTIDFTSVLSARSKNKSPILLQCFPNPVSSTATIEYTVPTSGHVSVIVYDSMGNQLTVLTDEQQATGHYQVEFNASNYCSGIYFYRFQTGRKSITKKMVLK